MNVLLLRKGEKLLEAFLASEARLRDAAEGRAEKMAADFVEPDITCLDAHRGAIRGVEIAREDGAGQPVTDAVHVVQHRFRVAPFQNAQDGAEDFLPGDRHRLRHVRVDGRLDEESLLQRGIGRRIAAAASARSASENAMSAFLPPNSSMTCFSESLAARITARPVGTLPISATFAIPGCAASAAPASRPPGRMLSAPAGSSPSISS